jgi:hypothetical protein
MEPEFPIHLERTPGDLPPIWRERLPSRLDMKDNDDWDYALKEIEERKVPVYVFLLEEVDRRKEVRLSSRSFIYIYIKGKYPLDPDGLKYPKHNEILSFDGKNQMRYRVYQNEIPSFDQKYQMRYRVSFPFICPDLYLPCQKLSKKVLLRARLHLLLFNSGLFWMAAITVRSIYKEGRVISDPALQSGSLLTWHH